MLLRHPVRMPVGRRQFLRVAASGALAGHTTLWNCRVAWSAKQTSDSRHGPINITEIEVHDISLPYKDWTAYPLRHYYGPTRRTVYVARADNGLIGLGESGSREPDDVIQKYIGTNPFDWVGDETSLGIGTAKYDLMGVDHQDQVR